SLSDYAKWINALEKNTLINLAPTLRRLRFPLAKPKRPEAAGPQGQSTAFYAAGWFIDLGSPQLLFHSGSTCGFNNFVIILPGDNWSIVCFANTADNSGPFKTILTILKD